MHLIGAELVGTTIGLVSYPEVGTTGLVSTGTVLYPGTEGAVVSYPEVGTTGDVSYPEVGTAGLVS